MKITKQQLKQIIKEELKKVLFKESLLKGNKEVPSPELAHDRVTAWGNHRQTGHEMARQVAEVSFAQEEGDGTTRVPNPKYLAQKMADNWGGRAWGPVETFWDLARNNESLVKEFEKYIGLTYEREENQPKYKGALIGVNNTIVTFMRDVLQHLGTIPGNEAAHVLLKSALQGVKQLPPPSADERGW
tara:strand:- start:82 stop:642 length:561 start_codon:yes stop_codon:yes gene_type:complete